MVIIRRIVTYRIFINKQLKHTNVTIRLALYIYIVLSNLGSSRAMLASDVWIEMLAIFAVFRRYRRRGRLTLVHTSQIATWRRSLT